MEKHFDYLIIGAGPAGLQLAYYLQQQKKSYLILEKSNQVANFFTTFPRHRKLISINKVFTGFSDYEVNLRWDWNSLLSDSDGVMFKEFSEEYFPSADKMVEYLGAYTKKNKLQVAYNSQVKAISRADDFLVETTSGKKYSSSKLIIATGVSLPYTPEISGIETATNYVDMSIDGELYKNKKILIIGKGNSGFETADHLIPYASLIHIASPNPIKMAWKTHYVGHLRAVNNNILDSYQLKSQNAVLNSQISNIKLKNGKYSVEFSYTLASKEVETIKYDHILVCTGFKFDNSIFDKTCQPKLSLKDRFPALTSSFESTNIKDLYFCGTLMQQRDFKKKQSGFVHGFRYNIEFLSSYLANRYDKKKFTNKSLKPNENIITREIINSVNSSSSLWQQTGFIGDVIAWDEILNKYRYFKNICIDYVTTKESFFSQYKYLFLITLEFGQERINRHHNVFAISRVNKNDFKNSKLSTAIHPIVRYYQNGNLKQEHHVIEDFESEWLEDVHINPLKKFISKINKKITNKKNNKTKKKSA